MCTGKQYTFSRLVGREGRCSVIAIFVNDALLIVLFQSRGQEAFFRATMFCGDARDILRVGL